MGLYCGVMVYAITMILRSLFLSSFFPRFVIAMEKVEDIGFL